MLSTVTFKLVSFFAAHSGAQQAPIAKFEICQLCQDYGVTDGDSGSKYATKITDQYLVPLLRYGKFVFFIVLKVQLYFSANYFEFFIGKSSEHSKSNRLNFFKSFLSHTQIFTFYSNSAKKK